MDIIEKGRLQDALEILQEVLLGRDMVQPERMTPSVRRSALAQAAKNATTLRKMRQKILGSQFSSDACWDLLLCLYVNWVEESRISVTDLTHETGIPSATVTRWLCALADQAMIARDGDPNDGRRTWIKLTQLAILQIEQVLGAQAFGGYCRAKPLPLAA